MHSYENWFPLIVPKLLYNIKIKTLLSTTMVRIGHFDSSAGIDWKLVLVQLLDFTTDIYTIVLVIANPRFELTINP